jgi:hypothetical protein
VVSGYSQVTGSPGTGGFPIDGSNVEIISNKIGFDTFVFNPASDGFRYLRTDTVYPNTSIGIAALLAASTEVSPIVGTAPTYSGSFIMPTNGQYLYLIWDYRKSLPLELCYSTVGVAGSCCFCTQPAPPETLCYSNTSVNDACCNC